MILLLLQKVYLPLIFALIGITISLQAGYFLLTENLPAESNLLYTNIAMIGMLAAMTMIILIDFSLLKKSRDERNNTQKKKWRMMQ